MGAYGLENMLDDKNTAVTVGASQSDFVISRVAQIECSSSRDMIIVLEASGVTAATGITVKLEHSHRKDAQFDEPAATETVAITGDGTFEIDIQRVLGTTPALKPFIRLVVDTGAGDAVTFDRIARTRRIEY